MNKSKVIAIAMLALVAFAAKADCFRLPNGQVVTRNDAKGLPANTQKTACPAPQQQQVKTQQPQQQPNLQARAAEHPQRVEAREQRQEQRDKRREQHQAPQAENHQSKGVLGLFQTPAQQATQRLQPPQQAPAATQTPRTYTQSAPPQADQQQKVYQEQLRQQWEQSQKAIALQSQQADKLTAAQSQAANKQMAAQVQAADKAYAAQAAQAPSQQPQSTTQQYTYSQPSTPQNYQGTVPSQGQAPSQQTQSTTQQYTYSQPGTPQNYQGTVPSQGQAPSQQPQSTTQQYTYSKSTYAPAAPVPAPQPMQIWANAPQAPPPPTGLLGSALAYVKSPTAITAVPASMVPGVCSSSNAADCPAPARGLTFAQSWAFTAKNAKAFMSECYAQAKNCAAFTMLALGGLTAVQQGVFRQAILNAERGSLDGGDVLLVVFRDTTARQSWIAIAVIH